LDKALFLTPEAPYPPAGGGALRSASLLEYLARRYRLDVVVFREPGAAVHFPPGLADSVQVIDLPFHARHFAAKSVRNAGRLWRRVPPLVDRFSGFGDRVAAALRHRSYALAVVEHFWCAPYWDQVAPVSAHTVLDLHNIESVLHQRCGAAEMGPAALAHRWFYSPCVRMERRWWPRYSQLLVASAADAELVRATCPQVNPSVYPNSIPLVARPVCAEENVIVFSGNMEYHPNVMAVRFFRQEIWPRLRRRWPQLIWRLVGKNAHAVRKYTDGDERIQTTGPVDDAITELARGKVAVVPLLAGSGTRLKIMEAWAAARAVVSTSLGAEGLESRHGRNILLADDPADFADAVSKLLESAELRTRIAAAGRVLYEENYTWESAWEKLNL
jgi:glycosyltransferase involved in cell wall biosynthesis